MLFSVPEKSFADQYIFYVLVKDVFWVHCSVMRQSLREDDEKEEVSFLGCLFFVGKALSNHLQTESMLMIPYTEKNIGNQDYNKGN